MELRQQRRQVGALRRLHPPQRVREPRAQALGEARAGLGRELAAPREERAEQAELLVAQLGRGDAFLGERREPHLVFLGAVAHHDGAGHHVAEALGARMQADEERAEQVRRRQEVGGAEEVPDRGGADARRLAGIGHHAKAEAPLARRLPAPEAFEEREVAVPRGEPDQDQHGAAEAPGREPHPVQDGEQDAAREREAAQDQDVDERRRGAGAEAGDLVVEDDVLRRLDLEVLAQVAPPGRRGGGHAAIVAPPPWRGHLCAPRREPVAIIPDRGPS